MGLIVSKWCNGAKMSRDLFTKNLAGPLFDKHAQKFVGHDEYMKQRGDAEWIEEVHYGAHKGRVLESNCESHMDYNLVMEQDGNSDKMEVTTVGETCQVTVDGVRPAGETIYDWEYLHVWSTIMEE